jgi:hypothetical protein
VLDLAGDGIELTSWQDGVVFDLVPWVGPAHRAWTQADSDDAWLVLDLSHDGKIDNGLEMFGDMTVQPAGAGSKTANGFLALEQYDQGTDGLIDERDSVYQRLQLWQDRNHDGVSQPDELYSLASKGVAGISVEYTEHRKPDGLGNVYRYSAAVTPAPGANVGMTAWDVTLSSPMKAERRAYGIADPVPVPDVDIEDDPSESSVLQYDGSDARALAPCEIIRHVGVVNQTGLSLDTSGWWTVRSGTGPCPPQQGVYVELQYKSGALWLGSPPGGGPEPKAAGSKVQAFNVCLNSNTRTWRGFTRIGGYGGIPGHTAPGSSYVKTCSPIPPPGGGGGC